MRVFAPRYQRLIPRRGYHYQISHGTSMLRLLRVHDLGRWAKTGECINPTVGFVECWAAGVYLPETPLPEPTSMASVYLSDQFLHVNRHRRLVALEERRCHWCYP